MNRNPNTPRVTTDLTEGPSKEELEERLFGELDPELKSWAVERVTMHPIEAKDPPGALDEFGLRIGRQQLYVAK